MSSFKAFILESSPRSGEWLKVFGGRDVRVLGPLPKLAQVCGTEDVEIYLLDLDALTEEQRERLVTHLSEKFKIGREELEREIAEKGVPILAEDVGVPIDMRLLM
ncbi:MAG: hypothetical protein WCB68_21610 [Pyrinomonadaceae bacterium]